MKKFSLALLTLLFAVPALASSPKCDDPAVIAEFLRAYKCGLQDCKQKVLIENKTDQDLRAIWSSVSENSAKMEDWFTLYYILRFTKSSFALRDFIRSLQVASSIPTAFDRDLQRYTCRAHLTFEIDDMGSAWGHSALAQVAAEINKDGNNVVFGFGFKKLLTEAAASGWKLQPCCDLSEVQNGTVSMWPAHHWPDKIEMVMSGYNLILQKGMAALKTCYKDTTEFTVQPAPNGFYVLPDSGKLQDADCLLRNRVDR